MSGERVLIVEDEAIQGMAAKDVLGSGDFTKEMVELFSGEPTGLLEIANLQSDQLENRHQTRPIERLSLFVALAVRTLTIEIFLPEIRSDAL